MMIESNLLFQILDVFMGRFSKFVTKIYGSDEEKWMSGQEDRLSLLNTRKVWID